MKNTHVTYVLIFLVVIFFSLSCKTSYPKRNGVYADKSRWTGPMVLKGDSLFIYTRSNNGSDVFREICIHYKDSLVLPKHEMVFTFKNDTMVLVGSRLTATGIKLVKISDKVNLTDKELWLLHREYLSE